MVHLDIASASILVPNVLADYYNSGPQSQNVLNRIRQTLEENKLKVQKPCKFGIVRDIYIVYYLSIVLLLSGLLAV